MIINAFPSGPYQTNAYVIGCSETGIAVIIDPSPGCTSPVTSFLSQKKLKPEKILITHSHWDHIADTAKIKKIFDIPVYVHEKDAKNIQFPGSDGLPFAVSIEGVQPDGFLEDNQMISVGILQLQVIHTPGHSPGGVCFYCKEQDVLISGDTIFKNGMGTLSLPTAQPELMRISLSKIANLPKNTKVYPGHGMSTTIDEEKWLMNYLIT